MLNVGQFIDNRYEILEVIGSGGMADVYKAKCHKLNRIVAIKMLKNDYMDHAELVSRFQIEAQAAACLSHNNIVAIYDVGQNEDCQYIVMEYVEGKTLKDLIEEKGALDEQEVVTIAVQIAQGIEAAHQQGIIHRDIKPQNILISSDGKVKVADFGIARISRFSNTIELMPAGSVHYIAPEQARGGYCDERSDIYALGATMYEMITGVVPFDADSAVAIAVAHMSAPVIEPLERNQLISPALNSIILKCMNKKPDDRYPNILALIFDLKKAILTPDVIVASTITSSSVASNVSTIKSKTIIMDTDMVNQLKKEKEHLGGEVKKMKTLDDEKELEDELEEEETTLVDKIILGVGIGIGVLILAAVIYVVASLSDLWSNEDKPKPSKPIIETTTEDNSSTESEESSSSEEETTTEEGLAEDETKMPSVLGMKFEEAILLLDEYDLQCIIPEGNAVYSDKYEEGMICAQEYEEGTILKKHTRVELTLSLGSGKFEITEEYIDIPRQQFEKIAQKYGLIVTYIEEQNDDYASGRIFKIDPESGVLERGDELTVYVSKGATYSKMPKLLNLNKDQAIATIEEYGLVVGNISEEYSNSVAEGLVCSQSVAYNKKVKTGTVIDIVISLGRKTVTVPNVVGMTEEKAIEKLKENELLAEITYESSNSVEKGKVISQTPAGYADAKSQDTVELVISSGKQSIEDLSEFVEMAEKDAKELLLELGLKYVESISEYHDTIQEGSVIRVEYYDKKTKEHYEKDVLYEGDYVVLIVSEGKEEETTEEPTTEEPTTEEPTTEAPTTEAPTTEAPTTEAPTTEAPTTEAPTTEAPTTEAPTTEAPTTEAPTTTASETVSE